MPGQALIGNRNHPKAHGLMQQLEGEWARRHGIFFHHQADPVPSRSSRNAQHVFKPKMCCLIGVCVCSLPGKAALLMWRKISKCFREFFPDKSQSKQKLENGLVMLCFDIPEGADHPADRKWFHLGYINRKTYHFTLMRMEERAPPRNGVQPLQLPDLDDGSQLFMLSMNAFVEFFDLHRPLTCAICYLAESRTKFLQQTDMLPHHVEVFLPKSADCHDFTWQGWDLEKPRPRRRGPRPKREGGQKEGPASKRQKKNNNDGPEPNPPLADLQNQDDAHKYVDGREYSPSTAPASPPAIQEDQARSVNDSGEDPDDNDDPFDIHESDISVSSDGDDANIDLFDLEGDEAEGPVLEELNDLLELAEMDIERFQHAAEPALSEEQPPHVGTEGASSDGTPATRTADPVNLLDRFEAAAADTDNLPADRMAKQDTPEASSPHGPCSSGEAMSSKPMPPTPDRSSEATDDISISSLSSLHGGADRAGSSSDGSSSDSSNPAPRKASSKPRAEKVVDDRYDMADGLGSIRYNYKTQTLVAFCPYHAGQCRRTRTTKPSTTERNADQGRPVGALIAWLQQAGDYASAKKHSAECHPNFESRKAARAHFYALEGGEAWATKYERPTRPGEDSEPANML